MNNNIAISVKNLTKVYNVGSNNEILALNNVSLDITAGSIFGLLGPNGAGKSTFINILADLVRKSKGDIKILETDHSTNLKKVKKAAINFHPGPPEYPATGCVNYAVYENSKFYGCTAHLINEKVDNGKIIDVKKFSINRKDNILKILNKTYKVMSSQAISLINQIKINPNFIKSIYSA